MTDKRPGYGYQYVQPRSKIPKLDISIVAAAAPAAQRPQFVQPMMRTAAATSSVRNGGLQSNHHHRPQHHQLHQPSQAAAVASEDLWAAEAEDDDFIMLASQVADKVENCRQTLMVDSMDMSFGDFQRNRNAASSSTQRPPNAAANGGAVAVGMLREDEDDVFSELPDFDKIEDVNKHISEYLRNDQNTLAQNFSGGSSSANSDGVVRQNGGAAAAARSSSSSDVVRPVLSAHNNYVQNVENARETLIKFLNAQLAAKQKDNEQLQQEVTKLNEKCQTKDGEIAMIRYDLQLNKKLHIDLRQEKITESERIKSEYANKLVELERTNQRQQTELEFKRLEELNLKSRRLHDTSVSNSSVAARPDVTHKLSDAQLSSLFRLHLTDTPPVQTPPVPTQIFHQNTAETPYGKHRPPNVLSDQLTALQLLAASLDRSPKANARTSNAVILDRIMRVVTKSLQVMAQDCDGLKACRANDGRQKNFLYYCDDEQGQSTRRKLLAAPSMSVDGDLFADESLRDGRRIVACLAAIGRSSAGFCQRMCVANETDGGGLSHVDKLATLFMAIGVSTKWRQYLGLVEASAELLKALAAHSSSVQWHRSLQRLLHAILFCRPNGRALSHISDILFGISTTKTSTPNGFLQSCCQHSADLALFSDSPRRVQFSPTSCTMQLFAVLLQSEFAPFGDRLLHGQDSLLMQMTLNALRLLQNGIDRPVGWMVRAERTANAGGDESGSGYGEALCLCYAQLVCACVVLVHLCLKQWILRPQEFDMSTIIAIAQIGVIFISDHFTMRFDDDVLRIGGPGVKQRLHVTFAWLQQYQKQFLFDRVHEQALLSTNNLRSVRQMFEMLQNAGIDSVEPMDKVGQPAVSKIWSDALDAVRQLREAPERESNDSEDDEEPAY